MIGSWCGKKFRPERVAARPGFAQIPAVKHQDLYEIKSSLILQPGPAALTDGLAAIRELSSGGQLVIEGTASTETAELDLTQSGVSLDAGALSCGLCGILSFIDL
jgi:hypothetical protein